MAVLISQPASDPERAAALSVSETHEDYDAATDTWVKCRDVINGSDAVKEKGEAYLPKLPGHDANAYKAYKDRATFYGAIRRTIKGMSGMVFMKNPTVEGLDQQYKYLIDDTTFTGIPLAGFAKSVFSEIIGMGRAGIMVDMPKVGAPEQRPYLISYTAEQIINWRQERQNGRMVTNLVVVSETYEEPDPADMFVMTKYEQYKVLHLEMVDPDSGAAYPSPRYCVSIYRPLTDEKTKQTSGYILYDKVYPLKNGAFIDYIPFVPLGPEENSFTIQQSPIYDMVEIVLSHYRTSADLENGRHWCGVPQPYLAGFPDKEQWQLGGDQIWCTSEPTAKAEFLEFKGTGLSALEKALEEKENKLAILGMRLLEGQKKGTEQPEALRLRLLGDVSTLEGVVNTVSQALTQAFRWAVSWMSTKNTEGIIVQLNKDYSETLVTAQDIQALVTLWQSEAISYKTLYQNLRRGEITREGIDDEGEMEQIQEEKEEAEVTGVGVPPKKASPAEIAAAAAAAGGGQPPPEDETGMPPEATQQEV